MQFPKKQIDTLHKTASDWHERNKNDPPGQAPLYVTQVDPKDLEDVLLYAELANAKIKELENDCSGLMFKIRCVAQALK